MATYKNRAGTERMIRSYYREKLEAGTANIPEPLIPLQTGKRRRWPVLFQRTLFTAGTAAVCALFLLSAGSRPVMAAAIEKVLVHTHAAAAIEDGITKLISLLAGI